MIRTESKAKSLGSLLTASESSISAEFIYVPGSANSSIISGCKLLLKATSNCQIQLLFLVHFLFNFMPKVVAVYTVLKRVVTRFKENTFEEHGKLC